MTVRQYHEGKRDTVMRFIDLEEKKKKGARGSRRVKVDCMRHACIIGRSGGGSDEGTLHAFDVRNGRKVGRGQDGGVTALHSAIL